MRHRFSQRTVTSSEASSYAFSVAEAERRHNRKALKQLRAIGPPPSDADEKMVQGKWLGLFFEFVRGLSLLQFARIVLSGPETSPLDLIDILRGMRFSEQTMWQDVSSLDLTTMVPALDVPVFFFLGRHDHAVPLVGSRSRRMSRRSEEPPKFNRMMEELARPAALALRV